MTTARLQHQALGLYLTDHPACAIDVPSRTLVQDILTDNQERAVDVAVGIVVDLNERPGTYPATKFVLEDHTGQLNCIVRGALAARSWALLRLAISDHTLLKVSGTVSISDFGLQLHIRTLDTVSGTSPLELHHIQDLHYRGLLWSTLMDGDYGASVYAPLYDYNPDFASAYLKAIHHPVLDLPVKKLKGGWHHVQPGVHHVDAPKSIADGVSDTLRAVKSRYAAHKRQCKKTGTTPPTLGTFAWSDDQFKSDYAQLKDSLASIQASLWVTLPLVIALRDKPSNDNGAK